MSKQSLLLRLRSLSGQPQAQAELAATLLDVKNGMEVVLALLKVLERTPVLAARPALLASYAHFEQSGEKRDSAANLRAAILRAARTVLLPADLPMLQRAVTTYVFPPPTRKEEGALVRSAALLALSEVDETLARFHAARLLVDEHTDPMSGEPALAALRVLAALNEPLLLYAYVMQPSTRLQAEVVSECLCNLTTIPVSLVAGLVERFANSPIAGVLVGLFDLLLRHRDGIQQVEVLRAYLHSGQDVNALRYLATVMMALGQRETVQIVKAALEAEKNVDRAKILREVFEQLKSES